MNLNLKQVIKILIKNMNISQKMKTKRSNQQINIV